MLHARCIPPLDVYLDSILASLFAAWPPEPPPGYAQRAGELAVIRRFAGAPTRGRRAMFPG